jgi:hypothetical protein
MPIRIQRDEHNPIVRPDMDDRILGNINGPSLMRVPDWIENPRGRYYLYFAHHQGQFIRMAYADDLLGPYTVYSPGVLDIGDTSFARHIASPDVHIDCDAQKIRMFYHGNGFTGPKPDDIGQNTCYAESSDGLNFVTDGVCLGTSYMRIFEWDGWYYGFGGGGDRHLWRTRNHRELFERGPQLIIEGEDYTEISSILPENTKDPDYPIYRMRHPALHLRGHELDIYYSNVGDTPERIKRTIVDLRKDWTEWIGYRPEEILRTETDYEGLDLPIELSSGGSSHVRVHQVRDPCIYIENDRTYLVYSVAGEFGLGIVELIEEA